MKRRWKQFGLVQIMGILAVAAAMAADTSATPDGAKIYGAKCASCHAKDGTGNPSMAKVFKVDPAVLDLVKKESLAKSDADLIKIVTDGVNKMPAYKGKLSDADIAAVVAYVRSLAPAPAK